MAVLALDLGTTGVKAIAVDAGGAVVARHAARLSLITDERGLAEQPVDAIEGAVGEVIAGVIGACEAMIEAVAISGAMHSLVPIGADDGALGAAMTWADRRAGAVADTLADAVDDLDALYWRTGCPWSVLYHPARLRWWAAAWPGVTRWAGIKDLIVHRLTGRWRTDTSLASATGLLDIHRGRWDERALELAGVSEAAMPELLPPDEVVGRVTAGAASATGLPAGVPVVAGASDGAMANVGAGAGLNESVVTVGTSAAVRRLVDTPQFHPQRSTWCYIAPGQRWLAGAAMNSGGIAVERMLGQAYGDEAEPWAAMEGEAAGVEPGSGGVTVLPFVEGERELIWPREAGWHVAGYDPARHGRAHLARATLEGVAFAVGGLWQAVQATDRGGPGDDSAHAGASARLTGGIVRSPLWRQIVADVLGIALEPIEAADASVFGAAMLALEAIGIGGPSAGTTARPMIQPNPEHRPAYHQAHTRWAACCTERGWWLRR